MHFKGILKTFWRHFKVKFNAFWSILKDFEAFWSISKHFEVFWNISKHFETFLSILNMFKTFWNISKHFPDSNPQIFLLVKCFISYSKMTIFLAEIFNFLDSNPPIFVLVEWFIFYAKRANFPDVGICFPTFQRAHSSLEAFLHWPLAGLGVSWTLPLWLS